MHLTSIPRRFRTASTPRFCRRCPRRADREAAWKSEREHVTLYVRNHPEIFRIANVTNAVDLSLRRWVVDEPSDLEMVREVFARLGEEPFGMAEVLALCEREPEIERINSGRPRDEGLRKSLAEDVLVR